MPYEVIANDVAVLIKLGEHRDTEGKLLGLDHETRIFQKGEEVSEAEISPVVVDQYDSDDKKTRTHVRQLLKRVEAPAKKRGRPAAVKSEETPGA